MKCALDILAVRDLAELNYQLEQAALDAKAALDFETAKKAAIDFCDKDINDALIASANRRLLNPSASYDIVRTNDRLGHDLFQLILPDGRRYADGRPSYSPSGNPMSLVALEDYLADHCLIVTFNENTYDCYGLGTRKCQTIHISVLPQN